MKNNFNKIENISYNINMDITEIIKHTKNQIINLLENKVVLYFDIDNNTFVTEPKNYIYDGFFCFSKTKNKQLSNILSFYNPDEIYNNQKYKVKKINILKDTTRQQYFIYDIKNERESKMKERLVYLTSICVNNSSFHKFHSDIMFLLQNVIFDVDLYKDDFSDLVKNIDNSLLYYYILNTTEKGLIILLNYYSYYYWSGLKKKNMSIINLSRNIKNINIVKKNGKYLTALTTHNKYLFEFLLKYDIFNINYLDEETKRMIKNDDVTLIEYSKLDIFNKYFIKYLKDNNKKNLLSYIYNN